MQIPTRGLSVAFLSFVTVLSAAEGRGQQYPNWEVSSGDWSNAANWNTGAAPVAIDYVFLNNGGTVQITQPGEAGSTLNLGPGTVEMTAGGLSVGSEYLYYGIFDQSGGTHATAAIYFGYDLGTSGVYNLSSSGLFSATDEEISFGSFMQSGGTNMVGYVNIGNSGQGSGSYLLSGGLLQINYGMTTAGGTLDFGGGSAQIVAGNNTIVDLSGNVVNTASASLTIGANALLIVPQGFSPAEFQTYSNLGLTHTAGTTLTVPAGQGFGGTGSISDPVVCQGTIGATAGYGINLNAGLALGGTGQVNLGSGALTIDDLVSSHMSGGSLSLATMTVGSTGAGSFTQSGGVISLSGSLSLGSGAGATGAYNLCGSGLLSATGASEYIGYNGVGSFTQSGGTNATANLYLASQVGSSGSYSLGGGLLCAANEYIGYAGSGSFVQTGGINRAAAVNVTGGIYQLSAGTLELSTLQLAGGTLQGGGVATIVAGSSSIVDLSGAVVNTSSTSLTVGPNSLVIVSAGFDPASAFQNYSNLGLTHTAGTTLTVSAGQGFGGSGTIIDPVDCQGNIAATKSGALNLANGLTVSGTGQVNLRGGSLTINDTTSNISSGTISGAGLVVGTTAANALFTQSGGLISICQETIGSSGTASFVQSGGTNTTPSLAVIGPSFATSTYTLGGSGQLTAAVEDVGGQNSQGFFYQTGGTNTVTGAMYLGGPPIHSVRGPHNGSGAYIMTGGLLIAPVIYVTYGGLDVEGGTVSALIVYERPPSLTESPPVTLALSGPVELNSDPTGYFLNSVGGGGSLLKTTSSVVELGSSNSYTGGTTIVQGALVLGNSGAVQDSTVTNNANNGLLFIPMIGTFNAGGLAGSGSLTLSDTTGSPITLVVGGNDSNTAYSGSIGGNGGLTKIGAGSLTLSGSNTFTGGMTVSSGTLDLNGAASLAAGSSLTIGSGASNAAVFTPSIVERASPATGNLAPVPEPGTLILLTAGALLLAVFRRASFVRPSNTKPHAAESIAGR